MLFRKKHPRSCEYCIHSTSVQDGQVLCSKRGLRPLDDSCRRFRYDPCKRVPPKNRVLNASEYTAEDFKL